MLSLNFLTVKSRSQKAFFTHIFRRRDQTIRLQYIIDQVDSYHDPSRMVQVFDERRIVLKFYQREDILVVVRG